MSREQNLDRFFGGALFGGNLFWIIILIVLLSLGDDLIQWILCNEEVLIWVVLLVLFFNIFDF